MNSDQNWYRQLAALVLLSGSKAAVEFITNPQSREDAGSQLKQQFAQIDYGQLGQALAQAIDQVAESSKDRLSGTIDSLRDSGLDAVAAAQSKAEEKLGQNQKKRGKKMRFLIGLIIGGVIAYFVFDEQRRDDLLDRMTGASGPIQPAVQNFGQQASSTVHQATNAATNAASSTVDKAKDVTDSAENKA